MSTKRQHLPVSFFGMAVGTLAWGHAWRAASQVWALPAWSARATAWLGLAVWLLILLAYARKWRQAPQAVQQELSHPVLSSMAALGPVSVLLAAITLKPLWPEMAWILFGLGLSVQLVFGVWLMGRFWQGGRSAETINAAIYLPSVAQNFVAATASAAFGWTALGGLFFGAGVISWLSLESLVTGRSGLHSPLPAAQRPLQGIQVAPALVGGLSYLSLTSGPPDLVAQMLLGYGLYQALLAARLFRWTNEGGFAPTYWAFSFGMMAMATMSLRMLERAPTEWLWQVLAPVLFAVANIVMASLVWRTLGLARQGRLLPGASATVVSQPVGRAAD